MKRSIATTATRTPIPNDRLLPLEGAILLACAPHTHMTIAQLVPRGGASYRVYYIDRRPRLPYYPPFVLYQTTVADALEQITAHELLQGE